MFKGWLKDELTYVLDFVEEPPNNRRYIVCREQTNPKTDHTVYSTPPHSGADLTHWRAYGLLSKETAFNDGACFHLGAHGNWLTDEEFIAWRKHSEEHNQRL